MIIHSGDCSNNINPYFNENEVRQFIDWYKEVPVKYKIYVAGNHDTSIEKRLVTKKDCNIFINFLGNSLNVGLQRKIDKINKIKT